MIDPSRHGRAMQVALLLALLAVAYLTLTPRPVHLPGAGSDKLAHAAAFFLLALLADLARPAQLLGWRGVALLCLYGAGIELAQHFIPNRSMSAGDMLADAGGALLYALLVGPWLHRRLRQARSGTGG